MKVIAKPIEMIVWFQKDGTPNPIKFKIENEDSTYSVIKVDKILSKDIEKLAGNNTIVFRCQSIIKNTQTIFEVKYELRTCRWMLFKI